MQVTAGGREEANSGARSSAHLLHIIRYDCFLGTHGQSEGHDSDIPQIQHSKTKKVFTCSSKITCSLNERDQCTFEYILKHKNTLYHRLFKGDTFKYIL